MRWHHIVRQMRLETSFEYVAQGRGVAVRSGNDAPDQLQASGSVNGQHGRFMHFAPVRNVYVYFRYDDDNTVMVVLNRDEEPVTLDTERFAERIGNATHGTDIVSGERFDIEESLLLEPRSALILELER